MDSGYPRAQDCNTRTKERARRERNRGRLDLESLEERRVMNVGAAHWHASALVARTPAAVVSRPDRMPPTAVLNAANVNGSNADSLNPYTFSITYADNVAVDRASAVMAMVVVKPPMGALLWAYEESVAPSGTTDAAGDARKETVTYQLWPPGGGWGTAPPGRYTVISSGLPVTDLAGNPVLANVVGSFSVRIAVPRLVVLSQPPDEVAVGAPFNLTVALENSQGSIETNFNGRLSVSLRSNPGGATLGGELSATASGGVAVFSGLTLDQPARGCRLEVSGAGLHTTTAAIESTDVPIVGFGFPPEPSIVAMQVAETKGATDAIILIFSGPMDRRTLTDLENYTLVDAGPDHQFGKRTDHEPRLACATTNAFGDSVTLTLKKPAGSEDSLALVINRQAPSGLRDTSGAYLNPWGEFTSPPKAVVFVGKTPRNVDDQFFGGNSAVLEVPTTYQAVSGTAPRPGQSASSIQIDRRRDVAHGLKNAPGPVSVRCKERQAGKQLPLLPHRA
jgi:hypothetical protein